MATMIGESMWYWIDWLMLVVFLVFVLILLYQRSFYPVIVKYSKDLFSQTRLWVARIKGYRQREQLRQRNYLKCYKEGDVVSEHKSKDTRQKEPDDLSDQGVG